MARLKRFRKSLHGGFLVRLPNYIVEVPGDSFDLWREKVEETLVKGFDFDAMAGVLPSCEAKKLLASVFNVSCQVVWSCTDGSDVGLYDVVCFMLLFCDLLRSPYTWCSVALP